MKKNAKKQVEECCSEQGCCDEEKSCVVKCPVSGCWSVKRALSVVLAALGVWCLVNGYLWQNAGSLWSLGWYFLGALLLGSSCQGGCDCCK